MENTQDQGNYIKCAIESLLFVNESPVSTEQVKRVFNTLSTSDVKKILNELAGDYDERQSGMVIREIAEGWQMLSNSNYASYIRSFYKTKHKAKLSKPSLETLAIIAYKQPVTRGDIELIRGVNSDGVVTHLLEKELIKDVGRKDVPGKPFLYGTTKQFMEYFGLKSLNDLPKLEEFPVIKPDYEKEEQAGELSEASSESDEVINNSSTAGNPVQEGESETESTDTTSTAIVEPPEEK